MPRPDRYVASEASQEPRHIEVRRGKVYCPLKVFGNAQTVGCDGNTPLDDLALVKLLEPEPYEALQSARLRLVEVEAAREAEAQ
eukprot:COSAG06_NODE_33098_length_495_cov_1.042929_1_plen_84_part_00